MTSQGGEDSEDRQEGYLNACPKCKDAITPFCGSCGRRIAAFLLCPWCKVVNEAERTYCRSCAKRMTNYVTCPWCEALSGADDSFCGHCGKMIAFTPFPYSAEATTQAGRLREVL